jgi:hypothetical protein
MWPLLLTLRTTTPLFERLGGIVVAVAVGGLLSLKIESSNQMQKSFERSTRLAPSTAHDLTRGAVSHVQEGLYE